MIPTPLRMAMNLITTEVTAGIKVSVETFYQTSHSNPSQSLFVFAYRITIENFSEHPVQVLRRHWFITDSNGVKSEVEGEGVVGNQPVINPGKSHTYVSGTNFSTEIGRMEGHYIVKRMYDRRLFSVKIPRFDMVALCKLN